MRRTVLLLTTLAAALLLACGVALAQVQPPKGGGAGSYIVVLEGDISNPGDVAREHARRHGAEVSHVYRFAIEGYAARISEARLDDVRGDSRVRFISEDRKVQAVAQTLPTGVNRIEGEVSSTKSGDGSGNVNVPVAIIDTGIDRDHPDLNVVGGKNCSTGRGYDDGNGHGTHVAGTVAARDNTVGVVGVAPGTPLYAVRVLDNSGSGSWSSVVCGIDWVSGNAASKGIEVANMSLGGSGSDDNNCGNSNNDALHRAICNSVTNKGVTYVVAAGNSGANLKNFVPAAYNEVLAVSAVADFNGEPGGGADPTCRTDVDETAANFSNFTTKGHADEGHTIAAPGVCIRSSWKGGGYKTISGTSMASPHAAGTAALYLASNPTDTPAQVIGKLLEHAAARHESYGFAEDPHQVTATGSRYYGYLEYAGGY